MFYISNKDQRNCWHFIFAFEESVERYAPYWRVLKIGIWKDCDTEGAENRGIEKGFVLSFEVKVPEIPFRNFKFRT